MEFIETRAYGLETQFPTAMIGRKARTSQMVELGNSAETGILHTSGADYSCDFEHHIYCLADMPLPLCSGMALKAEVHLLVLYPALS